jgi:crossover junction endodeoxyribonuclease RusA
MIEITLPWPDKRLSPNSRCHWREKAKVTGLAKWDGRYLAMMLTDSVYLPVKWSLDGKPDGLVAYYTFYPPDKRKRDIDNCLSMMKSHQDGVCSAFDIDDHIIKRTVLEWGEVVKGGKVVLRLEEME